MIWIDDELDLGADNLRNLAVEQAGGIGHERLLIWMHEAGLTQERAAEAIGISRRMLNYYLSGTKPIPKTVWLACVRQGLRIGLWMGAPSCSSATLYRLLPDRTMSAPSFV